RRARRATPGVDMKTSLAFLWMVSLANLGNAQVTFRKRPDRMEVRIGGKPYTDLFYGPGTRKSYLHPLRSGSGKIVTRQFPREQVAGERQDHPHHQGLSFTFADVNGFNLWASDATQQNEKSGSIRLNRVGKLEEGTQAGTAQVFFDWLDPQGKILLTEDRTMIFREGGADRILDFDISLRARERVVFGDTKEGMFNIRLASGFEEPAGLMTSSAGCRTEKECWGKRADWMEFAGQIDGEKLGVAIFDHPGNPAHPTYWHARAYGLFAANPFGVRDFTGDRNANGSRTVESGATLRFRYRVLIHPGNTDPDALARAYTEYSRSTASR
ncbi:MAG: PmoA family protein, partial [Acidobacteriota bacterium]